MSRFVRRVTTPLFLAAALACSASAGSLTPEVEHALAAGGGERIPVIVVLEDQGSLDLLGSESAPQADKIRALQENARASQEAFLQKFVPDRTRATSLWLVNAVVLSATPAEVRDLAAHPDVARVELDATVQLPPVTASDGSPKGEWTYGLQKIKIPEARQAFGILGEGVTVGVIDTGVDPNHPDLKGKVVGFKDFVANKPGAYDDQGHGTHCCGTIAGGNAGGTWIGVAPKAKLIMAKAFSSSGSAETSWLLGAMQWMVDPDGNPNTPAPSLVSNSWGGGGGQTTYLEATRNWVALGIFPCFAAGNSGPGASTVGTPGGYLEAFAVGATNEQDGIASFSSRGPVSWDGKQYVKPDVSAPGYEVYSSKPGGGYQSMSGTSMACPHVAGVIALLHAACPGISIRDVRELLEGTAKDLGGAGKDNTFGSGRVDVLSALQMAVKGGKLSGKLLDAATGVPLAGTVTVVEKNVVLQVPATGAFLTTLPEGAYTLTAKAFGYRDGAATPVTLTAGQTTAVELKLQAAATGSVAGTVKAAGSGVPLKAIVRVLDTPLAPIEVLDGTFKLQVPGGTYRLLVTSFGYAALTSADLVVAEGAEVPFAAELASLPPFLLVDDDKGKPYERFFAAALQALGKEFDVVDVSKAGQLAPNDVLGYKTVVWFTGDDYDDTLTDQDQQILAAYLKSGGRLVLSGQDIGYDLKDSPFVAQQLRAKFVADDSGSRNVKGQGLTFSLTGGDGADNQRYPDQLEVLDGATAFFDYEKKGVAGVLSTGLPGKVLYLAFGLEGVATADLRQKVMERALAAVVPTDVDTVARLAWFESEEQRTRWAELVQPVLDAMTPEQLSQLDLTLGGRPGSPAVRDLLRAIRGRLSGR